MLTTATVPVLRAYHTNNDIVETFCFLLKKYFFNESDDWAVASEYI